MIVGFAGSLRRHSYNRGLLRAAGELLPAEMHLETITLDELPLYNDDLASQQPPAAVLSFREKIKTADGLLIALVEYNYSISGVLKNALDWASTNTLGNILSGKTVAMMGASNGNFGTTRAQLHLRQVLHAVNAHPLSRPEVLVRTAKEKFDAGGSLTDAYTREKIGELLEVLHTTIQEGKVLRAD